MILDFKPWPELLDVMNDIDNELYMSDLVRVRKYYAITYMMLAHTFRFCMQYEQMLMICNTEDDVAEIITALSNAINKSDINATIHMCVFMIMNLMYIFIQHHKSSLDIPVHLNLVKYLLTYRVALGVGQKY